ncbi:hypothetical protein HAALTHF_28670n [Vreelandella aquamarina]|nr:hypothetical protein HAALTHF_28670n [Halomonas axialensis]
MHMTGYKLGEGVGDRNNRLMKVVIFHTGGTPKGTGASHIAASGGGTGAILRHGVLYIFIMACRIRGSRQLNPAALDCGMSAPLRLDVEDNQRG